MYRYVWGALLAARSTAVETSKAESKQSPCKLPMKDVLKWRITRLLDICYGRLLCSSRWSVLFRRIEIIGQRLA